ncbi:peptidylprolyl isomerase [Pseudogemmobacter faecipullorum]|uniref:Peptidyl-prolyl cis-trans isomerase n=1 Tax=Pseudogemmobacter faecipullorum TaxID=2755041 RepID=A0ABS8CL06_9RHOB|nr:peptidylprolyl isomerase [Pseudogemmobacter faecipullorum]
MLRKIAALTLAMAAPAMAQVGDGPGPNLVIEIAGEANGRVVIDLAAETAPKHVAQIVALAKEGAYDGVVFHRVIEGFMAQTGDVQFGKPDSLKATIEAMPKGQAEGTVLHDGMEIPLQYIGPGMGGSHLPDIEAEFGPTPFDPGVVGMARSQDPNSANSQFFIMFAPGYSLNGQYTVVGRVIEGMDVVNKIKRGAPEANGAVAETPDVMVKVTVEGEAAAAPAEAEAPAQ